MPVPDEIKYQLPVAFVLAQAGHRPHRRRYAASPSTTAPPTFHRRAVWFVDRAAAGEHQQDRPQDPGRPRRRNPRPRRREAPSRGRTKNLINLKRAPPGAVFRLEEDGGSAGLPVCSHFPRRAPLRSAPGEVGGLLQRPIEVRRKADLLHDRAPAVVALLQESRQVPGASRTSPRGPSRRDRRSRPSGRVLRAMSRWRASRPAPACRLAQRNRTIRRRSRSL